jgi:hypothetical protein
MNTAAIEYLRTDRSAESKLARGHIKSIDPVHGLLIALDDVSLEIWCDLLYSADSMSALVSGDAVLTWLPAADGSRGVVLGRIVTSTATKPRNLALQATEKVEIQCGEASIAMRSDGKVLVKGTDVVSRATRTNRIKGGAVAIN